MEVSVLYEQLRDLQLQLCKEREFLEKADMIHIPEQSRYFIDHLISQKRK